MSDEIKPYHEERYLIEIETPIHDMDKYKIGVRRWYVLGSKENTVEKQLMEWMCGAKYLFVSRSNDPYKPEITMFGSALGPTSVVSVIQIIPATPPEKTDTDRLIEQRTNEIINRRNKGE